MRPDYCGISANLIRCRLAPVLVNEKYSFALRHHFLCKYSV